MGKNIYILHRRAEKTNPAHIWTDTGATSAAIHINTRVNGNVSLTIEAKDLEQGAAALNAFIKARHALQAAEHDAIQLDATTPETDASSFIIRRQEGKA